MDNETLAHNVGLNDYDDLYHCMKFKFANLTSIHSTDNEI